MDSHVFIIGAGFNADAQKYIHTINQMVSYPLIGDLAKKCFGLDRIQEGTSIEALFQKAIDDDKPDPLGKLCDAIMVADHYLTDFNENSIYQKFIRAFPDSNFISFNYDAFLEILLLKCEEWRPEDGFGLPVEVEFSRDPSSFGIPRRSRRFVLHLHGSLYVYTQEFSSSPPDQGGIEWMKMLPEPIYLFDPDCVVSRFSPFERVPPNFGYVHVYDRIIAPVPNKASSNKNPFVKKSFEKAIELLSSARAVIAIGYSFNPADEASYKILLSTLKKQKKALTIINPQAREIAGRLSDRFNIECRPIQCSFFDWAQRSFNCATPEFN